MGEVNSMKQTEDRHYKATESKYKGGAEEMYVTYDVRQETRGGNSALYPKVKRVYIAGKVKDWKVGTFAKRTGREVRGVKIDYEQARSSYTRRPYTGRRGDKEYKVSSAKVPSSRSQFSTIVEVPEDAKNVQFHKGKLPRKY